MEKLTEQLLLNKRMCIHVDDYVAFHGMHRESEFKDLSHYLSDWIMYHLVPYWEKHKKNKMDNLLDRKINILFLSDYYIPCLRIINHENLEVTGTDLVLLLAENKLNVADYDLIINCVEPDFVKGFTLFEDKIKDGTLKLNEETLYLSFKSQKFLNENLKDKFFKQHLIQRYSQVPDDIDPLILKSADKTLSFRIQYGPWPMDYLDWKNFTPWKKDSRKGVKDET